MYFWEKCLVRTYHGFCENYDRGREDLNWWIEQVLDWNLLQLSKVSNDGLVVLKMVTDGYEKIHQQVQREVVKRNLRGSQIQLGRFVMDWQRKSIDTWSRMACLNRVSGVSTRTLTDLSCASLVSYFLPSCCQFFSRYYLIAPHACYRPVEQMIRSCFRTWDFTGRLQFSSRLLQLMLERPERSPNRIPDSLPDWMLRVSVEERDFLTKLWRLSQRERCLLLASVSGGFTSPELAGSLSSISKVYSAAEIDKKMIAVWENFFLSLRGRT